MRTRRTPAFLATAALAAGLAACDDATAPDATDDAIALDAAVLAADATLEEVAMFGEPIGFEGLGIPGIDDPRPHRRPGPPGGRGSFSGELSGTRAVSFYDTAGVEQDAYDALTTEFARIEHAVEGSIERDRFTAEIARERELEVSGLEGEETVRTWNGSGSSSMARSGVLEDGSERSHSAEGTFVIEDVVVPIPGSESRWPLSGTITRTMVVTRTGPDESITRTVEVVVTFDGTSTPSAFVDGEAVEIDLEAREYQHPLRRGPRG